MLARGDTACRQFSETITERKKSGKKPDPNSRNQQLIAKKKAKEEVEKLREFELIESKRKTIFASLSRVEKFCDLHLSLPGTSFDKKMLENGKTFASKAKQYLISNLSEVDVPLDPVLSDRNTGYYRHVIKSLETIGVEKVGDFIPYWKSAEERARLRRAWNISVGSAKHPTFLAFLVPQSRKEALGDD